MFALSATGKANLGLAFSLFSTSSNILYKSVGGIRFGVTLWVVRLVIYSWIFNKSILRLSIPSCMAASLFLTCSIAKRKFLLNSKALSPSVTNAMLWLSCKSFLFSMFKTALFLDIWTLLSFIIYHGIIYHIIYHGNFLFCTDMAAIILPLIYLVYFYNYYTHLLDLYTVFYCFIWRFIYLLLLREV